MSTGHSIIPPSSAGEWVHCHGWVDMARQCPDLVDNSESAIEGEAAHEVGQNMIEYGSRSMAPTLIPGVVTSNGTIVTDEMFDAAKIYADDVRTIMRSTGVFGGKNLNVEKRLFIPGIHTESYGTPDCFIYDRNNGHIYIWDFKYGHSIVETFENWQMINYLAGIVGTYDINGLTEQHITVHIRVIQPRAYHRDGTVREWVTRLSDLRGYWNKLRYAAESNLKGEGSCTTGSHCKHCHARYGCESAILTGMALYETCVNPTPVELTLQQVGVQLAIINRGIEALKLLQSGFEAQVESLIHGGKLVPGFRLENGKGLQKWNKPPNEVAILGDLMGINLRKPISVITPKEATKLGIDDSVIKEYSSTLSTGLKLVPDNGNKAKRLFYND